MVSGQQKISYWSEDYCLLCSYYCTYYRKIKSGAVIVKDKLGVDVLGSHSKTFKSFWIKMKCDQPDTGVEKKIWNRDALDRWKD